VKSSKEWSDYIKSMVRAKTAANKARIEMDYLKMRMQEWIAAEANSRVERKL
jgi:aspartate ammonia-lyase